MRETKKSKKFYLLGAILILIGIFIGGYLVLKSKTGQADILDVLPNFLEKEKQIAKQIDKFSQTDDLDRDGLANWQEEIYGTNPNNPDTDGDGYLDGEEIISGYDPLKPAPHDKTTHSEIPRPMSVNLTKALAKSMTLQIVQNAPDSLEADNALNQLDENFKKQLTDFSQEFWPQILDSEITILADNSQTAYEQYFAAINQAIYLPDISEDGLFAVAIESGDFSAVEWYIIRFSELIQKFKQIPVPSNLVEFHQKAIELLMGTEKVYQAVRQTHQDPLKTIMALQENKKIRQEMFELLDQLAKTLIEQGY